MSSHTIFPITLSFLLQIIKQPTDAFCFPLAHMCRQFFLKGKNNINFWSNKNLSKARHCIHFYVTLSRMPSICHLICKDSRNNEPNILDEKEGLKFTLWTRQWWIINWRQQRVPCRWQGEPPVIIKFRKVPKWGLVQDVRPSWGEKKFCLFMLQIKM